MPLLRQGVTGFDAQTQIEFAAFKKAVFASAQKSGASVAACRPAAGITPNFHEIAVLYNGQELCVICNRAFPIVAFVQSPIDMAEMIPLDVPELADPIREAGFEIALAADLRRFIEPKDLQLLTLNERKQAAYWKPQWITELVFNWWD